MSWRGSSPFLSAQPRGGASGCVLRDAGVAEQNRNLLRRVMELEADTALKTDQITQPLRDQLASLDQQLKLAEMKLSDTTREKGQLLQQMETMVPAREAQVRIELMEGQIHAEQRKTKLAFSSVAQATSVANDEIQALEEQHKSQASALGQITQSLDEELQQLKTELAFEVQQRARVDQELQQERASREQQLFQGELRYAEARADGEDLKLSLEQSVVSMRKTQAECDARLTRGAEQANHVDQEARHRDQKHRATAQQMQLDWADKESTLHEAVGEARARHSAVEGELLQLRTQLDSVTQLAETKAREVESLVQAQKVKRDIQWGEMDALKIENSDLRARTAAAEGKAKSMCEELQRLRWEEGRNPSW